jgi:sporulation protein YlmC with PRC-barrel domain
MKTHFANLRLILIGLSGTLTIPAAIAGTDPSPPAAAVRATTEVGAAVFSTDGARVGTVADFVLQFDALPQLRYVIVKSGGVLGLHADRRAIPADAITLVDQRVHVNLTRGSFEHLPVLPANQRSFLSYADNWTNLAKLCGTPAEHAALKNGYVMFSDLSSLDSVVGRKGEELGYFTDLWVDFNANECPYLECAPAPGDSDFFGDVEYDLPTTTLQSAKSGQIRFAVGEDELTDLKTIDDPAAYVAAAGEKLKMSEAKSGQ